MAEDAENLLSNTSGNNELSLPSFKNETAKLKLADNIKVVCLLMLFLKVRNFEKNMQIYANICKKNMQTLNYWKT